MPVLRCDQRLAPENGHLDRWYGPRPGLLRLEVCCDGQDPMTGHQTRDLRQDPGFPFRRSTLDLRLRMRRVRQRLARHHARSRFPPIHGLDRPRNPCHLLGPDSDHCSWDRPYLVVCLPSHLRIVVSPAM